MVRAFQKKGSQAKRKAIATSIKPITPQKQAEVEFDVDKAQGLYQEAMTRRAVFKTSDVDLSNDLVQTTFLKTLLYLQKGGKIDIMRAFLNHILNDLIIDEYRKRKPVSLDTLLENGFEPSVDDTERLMDIFDGGKIILLIDELPEKYQTFIKMRYVQGLSLKEISLLTGQTENTISVQSYRGLKKLKALVAEKYKL